MHSGADGYFKHFTGLSDKRYMNYINDRSPVTIISVLNLSYNFNRIHKIQPYIGF